MRAFNSLSELIMICGDKRISKHYRKSKGILVFRARAYVGAAALFLLFVMLAVFIADAKDPSRVAGKFIIGALFGALGLYLLLSYILPRVYLGAESITVRNAMGLKISIPWDDVKAVYKASPGAVNVCSEKDEIMIDSYFKDLQLIKLLLEKFRPEAFKIESLLRSAVIPKSYRKKDGALVFRVNKLVAAFIILFMLIALGTALTPVEEFVPLWGSQLASKLTVVAVPAIPVLLLLLYCLSLRVTIDSEKIEHKSFSGIKGICWKDVIHRETYVRNRNLHLKLFSRDKSIVLSGIFSGFELMMDIINKYCPEKKDISTGKRKKPGKK